MSGDTIGLTAAQLIDMLSQQQRTNVVFAEDAEGVERAVIGIVWDHRKPDRILLVVEDGPHHARQRNDELTMLKHTVWNRMREPLPDRLEWDDEQPKDDVHQT